MAAAPSAGPLTSLSEILWCRKRKSSRSTEANPSAAGCLLYFFNLFHGKGDETN